MDAEYLIDTMLKLSEAHKEKGGSKIKNFKISAYRITLNDMNASDQDSVMVSVFL